MGEDGGVQAGNREAGREAGREVGREAGVRDLNWEIGEIRERIREGSGGCGME